MKNKIICSILAAAMIMLQFVSPVIAAQSPAKTIEYALAYSKATDIGIDKNVSGVAAMEVETRRMIVDTEAGTQFKAVGKNVLLMVAYTAIRANAAEMIKVPKGAVVDPKNNTLGLKENMTVVVYDLIAAMLYHGDLNAAFTLALGVSGSPSVFVALMNSTAKNIGMMNTNYTNIIGAEDEKQVTTLEDLLILSYYCYQNTPITDITSSGTYFVKSDTVPEDKKVINNDFELVNDASELHNSSVFGIGVNVEKNGTATSLITYITSSQKFIFAIRSKGKTYYSDIKETLDFITKNYALVDISKIIFELGNNTTVEIGGEKIYFNVMKNTVAHSSVVANLYYSKSVASMIDSYSVVPPDNLPVHVKVGDVIPGFKIMYSGKQISSVSLAVKSIGEQEEETTSLAFTVYQKGDFVQPKKSFLQAHSWILIVSFVAIAGLAVVIGVEKLK